jgi:NAD(P)-dependent dehydrogenase (short-subunit alcohol dehydrogenase family)
MYSRFELMIQGVWAFGLLFITKWCNWLLELLPYYGSLPAHFQPLVLETKHELSHQVIIITGSNTGIGKQSALQLAQRGATVILACRDQEKGEVAALEINTVLKTALARGHIIAAVGKAEFMMLNLSDLHSVFDFATNFKEKYNRLDVLINNAGLNTDGLLINGLQQLFQVNYLGHYLLVRCLEDLLRCKRPTLLGEFGTSCGRVVNLSSVMHHSGQPNFKISALRKFTPLMRSKFSYYDDSKLYMNLLTLELNRRFGSTSTLNVDSQQNVSGSIRRPIVAISVNPGAVSSDIWRNVPFQSLWKAITAMIFLTTEEGAATTVYAASLQDSSLDQYRRLFAKNVAVGAGMVIRGDVPYLIPYDMPFPSLGFEMLGKFAGVRLGAVSLPEHGDITEKFQMERLKDQLLLDVSFSSTEELAYSLWEYSADLCHRILLQSGLSQKELTFLLAK